MTISWTVLKSETLQVIYIAVVACRRESKASRFTSDTFFVGSRLGPPCRMPT
jgi:hypothetical protein